MDQGMEVGRSSGELTKEVMVDLPAVPVLNNVVASAEMEGAFFDRKWLGGMRRGEDGKVCWGVGEKMISIQPSEDGRVKVKAEYQLGKELVVLVLDPLAGENERVKILRGEMEINKGCGLVVASEEMLGQLGQLDVLRQAGYQVSVEDSRSQQVWWEAYQSLEEWEVKEKVLNKYLAPLVEIIKPEAQITLNNLVNLVWKQSVTDRNRDLFGILRLRAGFEVPSGSADLYRLLTADDPGEMADMGRFRLRPEASQNKVHELLRACIKQEAIGGLFFARLCALVKVGELPDDILDWFKQKGLTRVLGRVEVNLFHRSEISAKPCWEIGSWMVNGTTSEPLDYRNPPVRVSTRQLEFPWFRQIKVAAMKTWRDTRYTVVGQPIYSESDGSVGILVPSELGGLFYYHTKNTYQGGGRFYVGNGGDRNALLGFYFVGEALKGKIPLMS